MLKRCKGEGGGGVEECQLGPAGGFWVHRLIYLLRGLAAAFVEMDKKKKRFPI